jgi:hypothetical protein
MYNAVGWNTGHLHRIKTCICLGVTFVLILVYMIGLQKEPDRSPGKRGLEYEIVPASFPV